MRPFYSLFISCIIFIACNSRQEKNNSKTGDSTIHKEEGVVINERETKLDTSTIITLVKGNPDIDSSAEFSVVKIMDRNDGNKYVIVSANTGTCQRSYFLMFDKKNHVKKCAELEANCDSDLSMATHAYKVYTEEPDTSFKIEEITQAATDSTLIDKRGRLKNGHSLDDVNCKIDTITKVINFSIIGSDSIPQWPHIWR